MIPAYPFKAAIFDLDGTLLDSMGVWARVDELFFERRGMAVPEDYGRALAGLSYRESAEYTIARFGFTQSWQEIVDEWTRQARQEYAENVRLKPGAREYLQALAAAGVKLAVATALPEYLYAPCLKHLGIYDMFAALVSTDDTGGRGKAGGEVFLLAAQRVGEAPAHCAVFEDVLEGVRGAKRAGMRAYFVRDDASKHHHDEMARIADGAVDSFCDLLPRGRCLIFTARCEGDPEAACPELRAEDCVLCADAGWRIAEALGIKPDIAVGDFDSSALPGDCPVEKHPVIKDDSDAMLCVRRGLALGYRDFYIVGGLGGRLDHTLANVQTLSFLAHRGAKAVLCDGNYRLEAVRSGTVRVPRAPGKLSVFALGGVWTGVSIRGAKYEIEDAEITPDFPIGMGNDFTADYAEIGVQNGTLLIVAQLQPEAQG